MRKTLKIDEDIVRVLQSEAQRMGRPYDEVVNAFLRKGIAETIEAARRPKVVRRFDA